MRWHELRFNEAMRDLDKACLTRMIGRDEYRRRRRALLDTWNDRCTARHVDRAHEAWLDALDVDHIRGLDTVRRTVPYTVLRAVLHAAPHAATHARPRTMQHGRPYATHRRTATCGGWDMARADMAHPALQEATQAGRFGGRTLALWATFAAVVAGSALLYWCMAT